MAKSTSKSEEIRTLISKLGGEAGQQQANPGAKLVDYWIQLFRAGSGGLWTQLDWTLINNTSCDAFAHFDGVAHHIGIYSGLIEKLSMLVELIQSNPELNHSFNADRKSSAKDKPSLKALLFNDSVSWIVMHELAHIIRGHVYYLKTAGIYLTLNESHLNEGLSKNSDLVRFFENDADAVGVDFAIMLAESFKVKYWSKRRRMARFRLLLIGVGLAMLALDRAGDTIARGFEFPNPHPYVRLLLMLDTAGAAAERELRLTGDEVVVVAKESLNLLSAMSKFYRDSSPIWPSTGDTSYLNALELQQAEKKRYVALSGVWFDGRSTILPPKLLV